MSNVIKSFKGFEEDMTCRNFKYEEGKDYETDTASACNSGFHACEYPLDVFGYYPPGTSVYHEVEQSGEISRGTDDSKVASTKIHIGAKIDIRGLVNAAIEFTKSRTTMEHTDPKLATAGDYAAATSRGSAASGKNGLSVARGNNVRVKGGIGAILVIAEESELNYNITDWKAVVVDGVDIKADTWYCLKSGELKECDPDE